MLICIKLLEQCMRHNDNSINVDVIKLLSHVQLSAIPQTVACQVPLSMGFPRQEHWIGLPCPPSGDLHNPGIEPVSPALADGFFIPQPPGKPMFKNDIVQNRSTLFKHFTKTYNFFFLNVLILCIEKIKL